MRRGLKAEGLRFYDLRGTAVTRFVIALKSYARVAAITGWEEARVEAIARKYVDRARLAREAAKQIDESGVVVPMRRVTGSKM